MARKVTLRAQWLGKILKDQRDTNALTLKEAAEYLQRDASQLSRFEAGSLPIRRGDVLALMDLYGISDPPTREILIRLTEDVAQTGWWEPITKDLSSGIADYMWLESRAERIRSFDVMRVNGLLQTAGYAEAWIRAVEHDATDKQISDWVAMRLKRQEVLHGDESASLLTVLDESALRIPVGGAAVMRDQLSHLLAERERPNVDVRVLPYTAGAHPSPDGGYILIKMADPFPEIAYADGPAGSLYLETTDAERLIDRYARLEALALSESKSVELIASALKDMR
ncbi:helix-turn-helix protein [Murinocardiopsis flavida]|uniref:Helix-turn-helix protein n=1 Tax=Murinocardiopsis flavida TaxID=645275 RepID=A0A2P8DG37_9ACTN|nr:helix-turn-helix transcriptional regulator [Murinocardiopsis flavida]PSK96177.1 helix-turn-helix protein [Murinocardiopsis flavida]